ncbi:MAG: DUF4363 family protein [Clostridia bacterium]|nr:DUF4363 family protein [Clostridia bacterium]
MQRYWFALITAVLVGAVIGTGMFYICRTSWDMEQLIRSAEEALAAQDEESALRFLKEGEALWEERQNFLEAVLDHAAVEQVSAPLAEAAAFLEYHQPAHSAARCRALLQTLQELRDGQQFSFYNLF